MGQCLAGVGCVVLGEGMVRVRGVALSAGEREEISRGLAAGLSGRAIGRLLGRDGSVINKEIARCGGREVCRARAAPAAGPCNNAPDPNRARWRSARNWPVRCPMGWNRAGRHTRISGRPGARAP